jgi:O-acetyl-ADP-ribose deacetylase (regulator of RNase III)
MSRYTVGGSLLELVQGDITQSDTDAIANAANSMLVGGGGVDGAIHRAAGPELMLALREVKRELPTGVLETGGAVITAGFRLPARYVIHCVGPIYDRERERAPALLGRCYEEALRLCREWELSSIAFPSISTGVYGYPVTLAAPIALSTVKTELARHGRPGLCRFVLFDEPTLEAYRTAADTVGLNVAST